MARLARPLAHLGFIAALWAGLALETPAQAQSAWEVLQAGKRRKRDGHAVVYRAFARMAQINDSLARESKTEIGSRNDALLAELERQRRVLGVLLLAGVQGSEAGMGRGEPGSGAAVLSDARADPAD